MAEDKKVIACNASSAGSAFPQDASAFVDGEWHDCVNDIRLPMLIRSRAGRWIRKWMSLKSLRTFRPKSIPSEHPLYQHLLDFGDEAQARADGLNKGKASYG